MKEEKVEERDLLSDLQDVSDSERKTSSAESSSGDCSPGPAQLSHHRAGPKFTAACFLPKAESGSGSEEEEEEEEETGSNSEDVSGQSAGELEPEA